MRMFRVLFLSLLVAGAARGGVDLGNLRGEAYTDMGHLMKAYTGAEELERYYLNRMGVSLTAEDTVQGRLHIIIGASTLLWQQFPKDPRAFHKSSVWGASEFTEASAEFLFNSGLSAKIGYFPYKYTPSMNLGEYLFRTESYPATLRTGGEWKWVDSARVVAPGFVFKWNLFGGKVRQEFGLFLEYQYKPLLDITPAYLLTLEPVPGMEFGGGVAWRRGIASHVEETVGLSTAVDPFGEYVEIANFPEVQYQANVVYATVAGLDTALAVWRPGQAFDPAAYAAARGGTYVGHDIVQEGSLAGTRSGVKGYLENLQECDTSGICNDFDIMRATYYLKAGDTLAAVDANGVIIPGTTVIAQYSKRQAYSASAVNVMGKFSLDFTKMLGLSGQAGPFKVFGEVAVLGLENQPVYFEKVSDRMPIMFGMHIPTFGLLELLSVEFEYFRNPHANSNVMLDKYYLPIPFMGDELENIKSKRFVMPSEHEDDWNWSVQAVRTLIPGIQLKIQAANDHMRLIDWRRNPDGDYYDALSSRPDHWYYLAHLQWGF